MPLFNEQINICIILTLIEYCMYEYIASETSSINKLNHRQNILFLLYTCVCFDVVYIWSIQSAHQLTRQSGSNINFASSLRILKRIIHPIFNDAIPTPIFLLTCRGNIYPLTHTPPQTLTSADNLPHPYHGTPRREEKRSTS